MTESSSASWQAQRANSSIQGIANLLGPFVFTLTFSYALGTSGAQRWFGTPFILAAILLGGRILLALRATRRRAD
jgi:DHA1 family tetracycline resistance protein-like MFS transporter